MLRLLPFSNFLRSCTYREEGILVASKQMVLIPDGIETVLKGFTYSSAWSFLLFGITKWSSQVEVVKSQGVTEFYVCNCMCSEWWCCSQPLVLWKLTNGSEILVIGIFDQISLR